MDKIGCFGAGWAHAFSTTLWKKPKYFEWAHGQTLPITFWVDNAICDGINAKCDRKIFWHVEADCMVPDAVNFIRENLTLVSENCEFLFTHSRELAAMAPNFAYVAPHATWIEKPSIYPKSKLVSLISSNKAFTAGHQRRLEWVEKFKGQCDVFGRGINDFARKEDALADYFFNICIENSHSYFSEKVLDCFATGTMPIYYGDIDALAQEGYHPLGIIPLDENFDISNLTKERYWGMFPYLQMNFERATRYETVEDELWERFLCKKENAKL